MIHFESGCLVECSEDMPPVPECIPLLYADFETSSGDPKETSVNPFRNCTAIGVAVKLGDTRYFVPRRFLLENDWWARVIARSQTWVNHNVKYDAHVSANDLGVVPTCRLTCTVTGAKLIDSDRMFKGGYGLDVLARAFLGMDIDRFGWRLLPYLNKNKDYGAIPLDILAEYALVDIEAGERLYHHIEENMPVESQDVWATEQDLTGTLFRMEQVGVRVDPTRVRVTQFDTLCRMITVDAELARQVGRSFRPHVASDCHDVLCVQYGLPVLAYTRDKNGNILNPSFDKDTLRLYADHPLSPPGLIDRILEYRNLHTFNGLFLEQWPVLVDANNTLHPSYNQNVRTGRMSCSEPNMQQLTSQAKWLVIPPEGCGIITLDYSQIEFRVIVHYLRNERCIAAYKEDPWTDFHTWVAEMAGTKRKPAKTLNFQMGFGAGQKSVIDALRINRDIVGDVTSEIDKLPNVSSQDRARLIDSLCKQRALDAYSAYHNLLPELKPTSKAAEAAARSKGYVRNHYGRRRHLDPQSSRKGFNSVCQSTAGDLIKERMVALEKAIPEFTMTTQVHDCIMGFAPLELINEEFLRSIVNVMNAPARPLLVPIKTTIAWSESSWGDASQDERQMNL